MLANGLNRVVGIGNGNNPGYFRCQRKQMANSRWPRPQLHIHRHGALKCAGLSKRSGKITLVRLIRSACIVVGWQSVQCSVQDEDGEQMVIAAAAQGMLEE